MFTIEVEAVFTVGSRGVIVSGTVSAGLPPPAGAIGQIQQPHRPPLMAQISGYHMHYQDRLPALDLPLRGVDKETIAIGQAMTFVPMPEHLRVMQARVYLLTPAEGGRRSPIKPGYRDRLPLQAGIRGQDGSEFRHRCVIELTPEERLWPGDERILWLQVWCIPELEPTLVPGAPFTLAEGQVVARGLVLVVR